MTACPRMQPHGCSAYTWCFRHGEGAAQGAIKGPCHEEGTRGCRMYVRASLARLPCTPITPTPIVHADRLRLADSRRRHACFSFRLLPFRAIAIPFGGVVYCVTRAGAPHSRHIAPARCGAVPILCSCRGQCCSCPLRETVYQSTQVKIRQCDIPHRSHRRRPDRTRHRQHVRPC